MRALSMGNWHKTIWLSGDLLKVALEKWSMQTRHLCLVASLPPGTCPYTCRNKCQWGSTLARVVKCDGHCHQTSGRTGGMCLSSALPFSLSPNVCICLSLFFSSSVFLSFFSSVAFGMNSLTRFHPSLECLSFWKPICSQILLIVDEMSGQGMRIQIKMAALCASTQHPQLVSSGGPKCGLCSFAGITSIFSHRTL